MLEPEKVELAEKPHHRRLLEAPSKGRDWRDGAERRGRECVRRGRRRPPRGARVRALGPRARPVDRERRSCGSRWYRARIDAWKAAAYASQRSPLWRPPPPAAQGLIVGAGTIWAVASPAFEDRRSSRAPRLGRTPRCERDRWRYGSVADAEAAMIVPGTIRAHSRTQLRARDRRRSAGLRRVEPALVQVFPVGSSGLVHTGTIVLVGTPVSDRRTSVLEPKAWTELGFDR